MYLYSSQFDDLQLWEGNKETPTVSTKSRTMHRTTSSCSNKVFLVIVPVDWTASEVCRPAIFRSTIMKPRQRKFFSGGYSSKLEQHTNFYSDRDGRFWWRWCGGGGVVCILFRSKRIVPTAKLVSVPICAALLVPLSFKDGVLQVVEVLVKAYCCVRRL